MERFEQRLDEEDVVADAMLLVEESDVVVAREAEQQPAASHGERERGAPSRCQEYAPSGRIVARPACRRLGQTSKAL